MPRVLEDEMSWPELCETIFSRIQHKLPAKDHELFKRWFMQREKVGHRFDHWLIYRCFKIWKELKNDLDHFIVLSGREGFGKSTLSFQLMTWIIPHFDLDNNVYSAHDYTSRLQDKLLKYQSNPEKNMRMDGLILDEGTELLSKESMRMSNRVLTKSFFVQRALKFCVCVCIPNFHMLDSVLRYHRCRTLIEIVSRGKYKVITGKAIQIIAKQGLPNKQIENIPIPDGTFWYGDFRKPFPKTISYEEYYQHKLDSIARLLTEMKDESISQKYISVTKTAKAFGFKHIVLIDMIKRGEIQGKQVGSRWYITKEAYDKLITP